jgi:hypothetical protein
MAIENGESLRTHIRRELRHPSHFHRDLQRWFLSFEQMTTESNLQWPQNIYRQSLFHVLGQGLKGQPIHAALQDLEREFEAAAKDDVERHLQLLPLKVLLPLLLLQFPAFLLILLGPILTDLLQRLSA